MTKRSNGLDRRNFLGGFGALGLGASLSNICSAKPFIDYKGLKGIGPLMKADKNGIRLPKNYSSRVVAESGYTVSTAGGQRSSYVWHAAPDGGACYGTPDGGWIYTSNAELDVGGGAGAFDSTAGRVSDAYPVLEKTRRNCAGGWTSWDTWLSCEEVDYGRVYECDIYGKGSRLAKGLGYFKHEAVAIDTVEQQAYLSEDETDGLFYRFTPNTIQCGVMKFDSGLHDAAKINNDGTVSWIKVPNPTPTKSQKKRDTRSVMPPNLMAVRGCGITKRVFYNQGR